MTKTIKYCSYPVEDGRCGVSFSTHGIRSSRKYCDEHLRKQGVLTRSTNAFSKVQDRETMRDYVRKEMQSTELTRTELTTKINTNHYNIRTELKEIKEILSIITTSNLEEYKIKQNAIIVETINARVDVLLEREMSVPIDKADRLLGYMTAMNTRIVRLEKDLDKIYKQINSTKKGRDLKRNSK